MEAEKDTALPHPPNRDAALPHPLNRDAADPKVIICQGACALIKRLH